MKRLLCAVFSAVLVLSLSACSKSSGGSDVSSVPFYKSTQKLDACNHVEGYHNIDGILVRYVGGMAAVDDRFGKLYADTEGYNIINFLQMFEIDKETFTEMVNNYGIQLNETTKYDIDVMYSGDDKKIEEFFTVK